MVFKDYKYSIKNINFNTSTEINNNSNRCKIKQFARDDPRVSLIYTCSSVMIHIGVFFYKTRS